jgi:hypothetical protein
VPRREHGKAATAICSTAWKYYVTGGVVDAGRPSMREHVPWSSAPPSITDS